MNDLTILHGDCLELMKDIPDGSIDMILCDLPYGTIKGLQIDGYKARGENATEWDEKLPTFNLFSKYERILRRNGVAVLFSQEPYTTELRNHKATNIEFSYSMIWKKDHFANALLSKKAPVSYFEDLSVFHKVHDRQLLHPLRSYFEQVMEYMNCSSCKDVNKALGHRKAEHTFYIDTMQFSLCTEKTYNELIDRFGIDCMEGFKTFAECQEIDGAFKRTFKRTFNLPDGCKYIGNVLEFKKDYQGFHPTQKPVALLEYLVKTYTNEGDTVLDNCMGSGSTGVACVNTGRKFIGMELDKGYFDIACKRIEEARKAVTV